MTETTIAKEPKETAHGAGDPRPVFALTVAELAEILDVSPRRVRQMRENGELQPLRAGAHRFGARGQRRARPAVSGYQSPAAKQMAGGWGRLASGASQHQHRP
ncbi:MAG: helix-turn-helix domain-containing protein [Roseovarius sp.]|nr:helix-turn-helix domain-containing protein [Roseovarius sp.]